jgi:heme exporter protein D
VQYVASGLSFAAAAVAVVAGARDGQLTATSWAALVVAVGSLVASLVITRRTQRELAERRARERRIQAAARREAGAAIAQLDDVLNYARFAATGTSARPFVPAPLDSFDSPEAADELASLSLTPSRSIGGPWAKPVPYGTDPRPIDHLIAEESAAAFERLDQVVTKYGDVLETDLVEGISELTGHPFAAHLRGLVALVDRRIVIEDSQYASVCLINPYAGSSEDYRSFVATLLRVDRLNSV